MSDYDFKQLSHYDFELLIAGLLHAEWGEHLEAFKSGRDGGIDLRYSKPKNGSKTIVQCKHYAVSGYNQLYRALKGEIAKVKKINPSRYVVATSVGLTSQNKDEIKSLFDPYIQTTGDILGQTDINLMLGRNPNVEKANFKLWLTSTAVMERVLHNAEHCQTEFTVDKILSKLPIYVQNDAYPRATEILQDSNIVVISGIPGIGKTTLAEMLIYSHLAAGYQPVVIKSNLSEGKKLYNKSELQVFYFDDFLGQTFLRDMRGLSQRNEDADLADFMEMIRNSKNAKLVMTTREHILKNAINDSEKLRHSPLISHKCVLSLSDYGAIERAKILYNHIYFSKLPMEYRQELLKNGFYKKVLGHRNFNPRLIEWLSDFHRVKNTLVERYQIFVQDVLDKPHEIWRNAFTHQISGAARSLLLFLYSMGGSCWLPSAEYGWLAIYAYQSRKYNNPMTEQGFLSAVKEVEGAFVKIENNKLEFINPSVTDFFFALLQLNQEYVYDLVSSASYFSQIMYLWNVKKDKDEHTLRAIMCKDINALSVAVERISSRPAYEIIKQKNYTALRLLDTSPEQRMIGLLKISDFIQSKDVIKTAKSYLSELISYWHAGYIDYDDATNLLIKLECAKSGVLADAQDLSSHIRLEMFKCIPKCDHYTGFIHLEEYSKCANPEFSDDENKTFSSSFMRYINSNVEQDLHQASKDGESLGSLKDFLENMKDLYGYDIGKYVEMAEKSLSEYEDYQERSADGYYDEWKEQMYDQKAEAAAIDHMFQSLN